MGSYYARSARLKRPGPMACSGIRARSGCQQKPSLHSCLLMGQWFCLQSLWPQISAVYGALREESLLLPQLCSLQHLRLADGGHLLAASSSWWWLLVWWTCCEEKRWSHEECKLNANLLLVNYQVPSSTKDEKGKWVSRMTWKRREPGAGTEDEESLRSAMPWCFLQWVNQTPAWWEIDVSM